MPTALRPLSAALIFAVLPLRPSAAEPAVLSPVEAGARYGQALGVELLCLDMVMTPAASALKAQFSGAELEAFNMQSEKILGMWKTTLACTNAGGPNECRLSHMWSCQEAAKEIGPRGTKLPGLIGPK